MTHTTPAIADQASFETWLLQNATPALGEVPLTAEALGAARGPQGDYSGNAFLHGCWEGWQALGTRLVKVGILEAPELMSREQVEAALCRAESLCKGPCYVSAKNALAALPDGVDTLDVDSIELLTVALDTQQNVEMLVASINLLDAGDTGSARLGINLVLSRMGHEGVANPRMDDGCDC